jgi:amino acid transporter
VGKIKRLIIGDARDVTDPHVFHKASLVAFLAWIGLGADGLSSSSYGPDEAYRALGTHTHLALFLVLMTAVTILVISIAYSNLIQHFPGGGGGYLVATKLLGARVGVVSGCALLVDYVLTIATSVASGCDQLWSYFPIGWAGYKMVAEIAVLLFLIVLNLRGVKESVTFLTPIFIVFVGTHLITILYAIGSRFFDLPVVFHDAGHDLHQSVKSLGGMAVALILLRAYSMGAGTYTGIEAVSNGVTMLREPRVKTAKTTMFLMAFSLAFTAGGIMLAYLLTNSRPMEGKTMNAVMLENLFNSWRPGGIHVGAGFVILTLTAEAALLFVAAQTGFLDGPRILSNMAVDSWMPHRFSQLSERLVTNNGIYLMGAASIAVLLYTRGDIVMLVVMYSINVFITFSLTELGMSRHWIEERAREPHWKSLLAIHGTGLVMCVSILTVVIYEKFAQGGWMTILITSLLITLSFAIRRHYVSVRRSLRTFDQVLTDLPPVASAKTPAEIDPTQPTAVVLVKSFTGFGIHQVLSIHQLLPGVFKNFLFVSAAIVDSGSFKGADEIGRLEEETRESLEKYVAWAQSQGLRADYRMAIGTDPVETVTEIAHDIAEEFSRPIFFLGKLIFKDEKWFYRILHNETPNAIQRRLQFDGLQAIVLPIRILQTE